MPDRDVFDRHVPRGWQTAARLLVGGRDDGEALLAIIRVLGRSLKNEGCPGLDEVVRIVGDAILSPDRTAARQLALAELDHLRLQEANRNTEIAVISARGLLASGTGLLRSIDEDLDRDEVGVHLAVLILADLADAMMFPAPILGELVETAGFSFQSVRSRRHRGNELVATSPETRRLAAQILTDPSGRSVKAPRLRREKLSQAEILVAALTE